MRPFRPSQLAVMVWMQRWAPRPGARLRLLCFPCAAGTATAYRAWPSRLPEDVEVLAVELPGHGKRYGEALPRSVAELTSGLVDEYVGLPVRPVAVHGHSMGALLALEFARELRRLTGHPPVALFLASCDVPGEGGQGGGWAVNPVDDHWRTLLREIGGVDQRALSDEDLMSALMPVLRADVELMRTYRPASAAPLRCPVRVYAGITDPGVSAAGLAGWQRESPADFQVSRLPGGHFFLRDNEPLYLARITTDLTGIRTRRNGVVRWTPSNRSA